MFEFYLCISRLALCWASQSQRQPTPMHDPVSKPGLKYVLLGAMLFLFTGLVHAQVLVAVDDSVGVPFDQPLQVEAFGVLENDTLDGNSAGENGATAKLLSGVTYGTLSCPTEVGAALCSDGSFEYMPGLDFPGTDSFTYQAVFGDLVSEPATVTLKACTGGPDVFTCWHEAPYLAKLAQLGYSVFLEGFEGSAWDEVRSPDLGLPITAPSITSKGITWTTNHPDTNGITTGSGPARTGFWGGFDPDHGFATGTPAECDIDNPPLSCRFHDGLSGENLPGGGKLHGVGGYITGFANASIAIILDGTSYNVGKLPGAGHHFFGVIDATAMGFTRFEFRELSGKVGQELLIFGDDFFIATSAALPPNNPPVLDLIGDRTVDENTLLDILLTASDPDDGDSWHFSMSGGPAGASLEDNFDGTATFSWRPDFSQSGSYPMTFTVTDNGLPAASDSEAIIITVTDSLPPVNNAPVANAGADQTVFVTDTVTLDGSGSTDIDGDALTYVWSLTAPPSSAAGLDTTDPVYPTFVLDVPGTYTVQLIVNDGALNSDPDTVNVTSENSAPVADAGSDQLVVVSEMVVLDGSGSNDIDGDMLDYSWSFISVPSGSTASMDTADPVYPNFVTDVSGTYVVQLMVNDGAVNGLPDTVSITAEEECSGIDLFLFDMDFISDTTYCIGDSSITVGQNVTVGSGAGLVLTAPIIRFMNNVSIEPGATLQILSW